MIYVLREGLPLLSKNYEDFELLDELIRACGGHHPGILLIRSEKDRSRNLRPPTIVACIGKLVRAEVPIADQVHILNRWR
jgi:hypothetical protein